MCSCQATDSPLYHTTFLLANYKLLAVSIFLYFISKLMCAFFKIRFQLLVISCNICLSLTSLNMIKQAGPSRFKWYYVILFAGRVVFHCICVPQPLYPFFCPWTFRLFPCLGYCKQCCCEHWGSCIFLSFLWINVQLWDCRIIW